MQDDAARHERAPTAGPATIHARPNDRRGDRREWHTGAAQSPADRDQRARRRRRGDGADDGGRRKSLIAHPTKQAAPQHPGNTRATPPTAPFHPPREWSQYTTTHNI